ncbi:START domain-containing protein 10-like [Spea bombifrons]|uniref:START domain-containing protein 10-like n=1 Tax=Spea bombifrons TaxID=233779 RepID=UPI0023497228|nr:START domain-containing protein 10-like [Spea bombifrons]
MAQETPQIPDDSLFLSFRTQCESNEGWVCTYSKSGTGVWLKPPTDKASLIHTVKGCMTFPDVSADTVYDVLHDTAYRRKWDLSMIETRDIAQLSANADVGYYSWKCPKPLKNRDVVTLRSWLLLDEFYMIINFSVKHKLYPPRKDMIRAVSHLAGYLIKITGPNSCILTYLAQVDPRGSLPKWVVNKSSQYLAPKILRKLYKACVQYPVWKKKNQPGFKPWLNPEQNTLPRLALNELSLQRAESLEHVDESRLCEVKEEKCNSDDDG